MMENSKNLLYDGSFNGFLSCIYRSFEQAYNVTDIRNFHDGQKSLFAETSMVETNVDQAKRVWDALERQHYQAVKKIYFAFLSERKGIEILLYRYICSFFRLPGKNEGGHSPALAARIETLASLVASEKDLWEKKVGFSQGHGQPAMATLSPAYDILPLLTRYLRNCHADFDWLVYDSKRHYGFYYHRQNNKCLRLSKGEIQYLLSAYGSNVNPLTTSLPSNPVKSTSVQKSKNPGKEWHRFRPHDSTAA